jgi:hypothetical protein
LEIEKMLMAFLMLHPIFSILQVLLKFGGKDTDGDGIYDKDDASRRCWFKNSTVVLILMETESKIVLMLVQTYLV